MQRRRRDAGGIRRLVLSRETLLDLSGHEEQTEGVRGGTAAPEVTQQPSFCRVCVEGVPPTRQTYPVTGDVCAQLVPKKKGRYRVKHRIETEYEYTLLDFEETPGGYRTDHFIIEGVSTRVVDSTSEEIPPTT